MPKFNIADAKARFPELVQKALSGEEVIIAEENKTLLKLVSLEPPNRSHRTPGPGKGQVLYTAPDFDETPDDFKNCLCEAEQAF